MDRQLRCVCALLLDRLRQQESCEFRALTIGNHPTNHISAVDIDHRVEIEIRPFLRSVELGNIPGVNAVRSRRAKLGFDVGWARCLVSTFADFTDAMESAIYRRNRAVVE